MFSLDDWVDSCTHETQVIQFLATKMPDGVLDYRPTAGQRSMLELLQYMTCMASPAAARAVDGDWSRGEALTAAAAEVTAESFADAMDAQMAFLCAEAETLRTRPLAEEACTMPIGTPCTTAQFLVNAVLKCFTSYKMQFFLYLKAAGAEQLGSYECWFGMEPPEPS